MNNNIEPLINEVMHDFGFHDIQIIEQFHKDTERLIYVVETNGEKFLLRGLPDHISESVIQGNTRAQEYLGNEKRLAPQINKTLNGSIYTRKSGYWFYLLEYLDGRNMEENEEDEKKLGCLLKIVHSFSDYQYTSHLNEDKSRFYDWFKDKSFKDEFDRILDNIPDFSLYDRCFIHSDVGPHNSIKTADGKIVLIDLDDAGVGSRFLDLGWPFIMQFVDFNHDTEEMRYRFDLAKAFLRGYYGEQCLEKKEYDLLWQGAIYMHISYMQTYGPYAVDSLWKILVFGMEQKDTLWEMID